VVTCTTLAGFWICAEDEGLLTDTDVGWSVGHSVGTEAIFAMPLICTIPPPIQE
jgi:hypothetical protein